MAIVVGIDGSTGSAKALEWAMEAASLRGTGVVAVWTYVVPVFMMGPDVMSVPVLTDDDLRGPAASALTKFVAPMRAAWPDVVVMERVVSGRAATVLRDEADRESADLLVVGSRGLGGFKGLLLGSVSSQCLHHPPRCPVVVVPDLIASD